MAELASAARAQNWRDVRAIVLARDGGRCKECGEFCSAGEADVHHLVPRAGGGLDDAANLITLCDGCHAARHPNLQGTLARRTIERWALRFAKLIDRRGDLTGLDKSLGATLRLLGVTRFRTHQLAVVLAALRGESLWLFLRSNDIVRAHGCCDHCDQVRVDNVVGWADRLWGSELRRRSMFLRLAGMASSE